MSEAASSLGKLPLEWVRPPRQARTHATLGKLLDSAESLLGTKTWDEIAVSEIAKAAGSSVGAFYRRFKDKDGALHALHERFCEEAIATADAALDPARWAYSSLGELCHETFGFLMQVLRERHGLDRAIYERSLFDDLFRERALRLNRYVMTSMAGLILARSEAFTHPRPEVGVEVALRQAFGLIVDTCTVGSDDVVLVELDDGTMVEEMVRSMLAYLGAERA